MTLMTRKEAAARLGISVDLLDQERSAGRLAYIQRKPGSKVCRVPGAGHPPGPPGDEDHQAAAVGLTTERSSTYETEKEPRIGGA